MKYVFLIVGLLLALIAPAAAKSVALVIGNDHYTELAPLQKAVADARTFAGLLKEKGYEVIYREDATRAQIDDAIAEMLGRLATGDTAAVFYSGHGWSDGKENFLLGIDAPFKATAQQQERMSIPVQNGANGLIDSITESGAALSIIIIDACRSNPFEKKDRALTRGLVLNEPPQGTFVIFSAGAGQVALDRLSDDDTNPNSVFTRIIVPLLRRDLPLIQVVKEVQTTVHALAVSVDEMQEPAYYDQVRGTPCLTGFCTLGAPTTIGSGGADEASAFTVAAAINSSDGWEAYIQSFPSGNYTELARQALQKLKEASVAPELQVTAVSCPSYELEGQTYERTPFVTEKISSVVCVPNHAEHIDQPGRPRGKPFLDPPPLSQDYFAHETGGDRVLMTVATVTAPPPVPILTIDGYAARNDISKKSFKGSFYEYPGYEGRVWQVSEFVERGFSRYYFTTWDAELKIGLVIAISSESPMLAQDLVDGVMPAVKLGD